MSKLSEGPRIDPRIKAILGEVAVTASPRQAQTREAMLAEANAPEALAARQDPWP